MINTKKQIDHNKTILFLSVIILSFIGILVRIPGLNHIGGDMIECLIPWYDSIAPTNGIYSLRNYTGNYGMPYVTILWFLHFIPGKTHIKIKAVSILFEYLCAVSVGLLSSHFFREKKKTIAFICGFGLTLFYPVIIINGAWWGQCDSIYASFVLLMIYAFLKDKPALASVFLGCAFAFKFQAIFIIPFVLLFYYFRRTFSLLNLILVPITIEILYIPAMIAGYSPLSPITIYAEQAGYYPEMYMYYPGLWSFFWRWSDYDRFHIPAIAFVLMVYALIFSVLLQRGKDLSDKNWIETAFLTSLIGVYFLPAMHERYGIIAELTAIIYAIIHPKRSWTSLFIWASITWTIIQPLFMNRWPEHKECAAGLLFIIIILISFYAYDLKKDTTERAGANYVNYRSKFEKITEAEQRILLFTDKYAYLAVYVIVFAMFIYSGICLLDVSTPALETGSYLIHELISMAGIISAALIWTCIIYELTKKSNFSFPIVFLILPTTLFYTFIGKYQDGLCLLLIGIGMMTFIKFRNAVIAGIIWGLGIAFIPYYLIFLIGIICIYQTSTKKADTGQLIKLAVSALITLFISLLTISVTGIRPLGSSVSLCLSYTTNGAIYIPVCLLMLIEVYINSKYLLTLLIISYAALLSIGKYMYVVDERFYKVIPILIVLAIISAIPVKTSVKC